jgi:hypothetical protein
MCLVLAMNEASEADITYEDVPFASYEYPTRYRNRIREGERFVYYRGRRRAGGGRQPQVYLGTGVIGAIRPSRNPGRLVCQVLDGDRFPEPLPFKDEDGSYLSLEAQGAATTNKACGRSPRRYSSRSSRRVQRASRNQLRRRRGNLRSQRVMPRPRMHARSSSAPARSLPGTCFSSFPPPASSICRRTTPVSTSKPTSRACAT